MSLKFVLISVAITCANKIIRIVGTLRVTTIFRYSCGTMWINAILKQLTYPNHSTGFATFFMALKYSLIASNAIIANAMSTIILFPNKRIINTSGKPNNPDVILFISIYYQFLL